MFQSLGLINVEGSLDYAICLQFTISTHADASGDSSGHCFGSAFWSKEKGACSAKIQDKDRLS